MHHDLNNVWDWVMVVPLVLGWLLVLGAVVYAAVRMALDHHGRTPPLHR